MCERYINRCRCFIYQRFNLIHLVWFLTQLRYIVLILIELLLLLVVWLSAFALENIVDTKLWEEFSFWTETLFADRDGNKFANIIIGGSQHQKQRRSIDVQGPRSLWWWNTVISYFTVQDDSDRAAFPRCKVY